MKSLFSFQIMTQSSKIQLKKQMSIHSGLDRQADGIAAKKSSIVHLTLLMRQLFFTSLQSLEVALYLCLFSLVVNLLTIYFGSFYSQRKDIGLENLPTNTTLQYI